VPTSGRLGSNDGPGGRRRRGTGQPGPAFVYRLRAEFSSLPFPRRERRARVDRSTGLRLA
jgi:hypothetical protein